MKKYSPYKLINDAPYGNINYYTISLLYLDEFPLDIYGFKVYNGYTNLDQASEDAEKIRSKNSNHDVMVCETGKIYSWKGSDSQKTIYDNEKLNKMELKHRENADKAKLLHEQYNNERKIYDKKTKIQERLRNKLYERGQISMKEYNMLNHDINKTKDNENIAKNYSKIIEEAKNLKIDYLDENEEVALRYGCISVFNNRTLKGLKENLILFKIRGLFETQEKAIKRRKQILKDLPNDNIIIFEISKWCPYSINDEDLLAEKLNYLMKKYLDEIENRNKEFKERQNEVQEKKETKQKKSKKNKKTKKTNNKDYSIGIKEDDEKIEKLIEFLEDDEVIERYSNTEKPEYKIL